MPRHNKILVLGHARCGTGYSFKLLNSYGFKIGHERYRDDGISSWCQVPVYENNCKIMVPWGPTRYRHHTYDVLIHNVRDPFNAIHSIALHNRNKPSIRFITKTIKNYFNVNISKIDNELDAAAASYYYWNKLIEQYNPDFRLRVEHDQQKLADYLNNKYSKNIQMNKVKLPQTNYNTRRNKQIFDLSKMSKKYINMLDELCDRYRYPTLSSRIN